MIIDFLFVISIITWSVGMYGVVVNTDDEWEEIRKTWAVILTIFSTAIFIWCVVSWKDSVIIRPLIEL